MHLHRLFLPALSGLLLSFRFFPGVDAAADAVAGSAVPNPSLRLVQAQKAKGGGISAADLQLAAPAGYHLNAQSPVTVSAFLCDDAKTLCVKKTLQLVLKEAK